MELNSFTKLSRISLQLFRSRLGCYACIFPSKRRRRKKKAVNLISIIATQGPKKRRDLQIFLGPLRPGVAGSAAQTSRVDVKSPPRRKYYC